MRRLNFRVSLLFIAIFSINPAAFAQTSLPAPLSFLPSATIGLDANERSVTCLAQAIVYEAGQEPIEGQQAVAQVIMNRTQNPGYPKSPCDVVYQGSNRRTGCQFTFTCDGSLRRKMPDRMYLSARAVAQSALLGTLPDRVGNATHYHAYYVSPYWAPSLNRIARIGAHIFYHQRWSGSAVHSTRADFIPARSNTVPQTIALRDTAPLPFSPWGLPMTGDAASRTVGNNR